MEMSVENEEMDDNQSDIVTSMEEDESAPNSEEELECGPSRSESEPLLQEDGLLLRNILEEEIWRVVLGKVKERPEVAEACANATPYFQDLLLKDRTEFLFPKVIDLLAVRNEERENNWDSNDNLAKYGVGSNEYLQELRKDHVLWRESVMNCRLVCHAWKNGVDQCYQKSEMSGIPEFVTDPDPRTRLKTQAINLSRHWTKRNYRIVNFEGVQRFLDYFTPSHYFGVEGRARNPFVSRFMSFELVNTNREDIDEYIAGITTILEMWGQELWYCCLEIQAESEMAAQHYRQLVHWLALMPNLKYLKLHGLDCTGEMTAEFFAQNSLPTLEKLEALDLAVVGTRIVNQLLYKNNRISILKTYRIRGIDEDVLRSLTNLKGLSFNESELGNQIVEKYGTGWKINKLTFEAPYFPMKGAYLFQCLQAKWSNTLTELKLEDPFVRDMDTRLEQSRSLRLDLPCLRTLSLKVEGSFYLDFILPSKNSLEHIKINQQRVDAAAEVGRRKQVIQYVGFEETVFVSNIWGLFPKLETLIRNKLFCERNFIVSEDPSAKYFHLY